MKGQIIIWGTGNLLQSYKTLVDLRNVVAYVDSNEEKQNTLFMGNPVICPADIKNYRYDKLIIFVKKQYDEIYQYAVKQLKMDASKILYWSCFYGYYHMEQTFKTIEEECKKQGIHILIDYGCSLFRNSVYSSRFLEVWGCEDRREEKSVIHKILYNKNYKYLTEVPRADFSRAVFAGRIFDGESAQALEQELSYLTQEFEEVFYTLPYADTEEHCRAQKVKENDFGEVIEWKLDFERLICIRSYKRKQIKIMIAAHKEFMVPANPIYEPIWLGDSKKNSWNYLEDKQEPSISFLNPMINECTGLFWMWKHIDCDYIGLVHYRRYFLNDAREGYDNLLGERQIKTILTAYDVITAPLHFIPFSVENQLKVTLEADVFETGYRVVRDKLLKKQSEYADVFEVVMKGHSLFPCNMFVTRKELFDQYCEWLFSIIIDAAMEMDVSQCDNYSKRVIGFFAERLLTVWLLKQSLRIKEMPVWITETITGPGNIDVTRGFVEEKSR